MASRVCIVFRHSGSGFRQSRGFDRASRLPHRTELLLICQTIGWPAMPARYNTARRSPKNRSLNCCNLSFKGDDATFYDLYEVRDLLAAEAMT
jgi:hypothetical protein